jgi:predicted aspartyl protease
MRQCSLISLIAVVCLNRANLRALDNACSGDQDRTPVAVRIEDSLILVPVKVDDHALELTFLFDTGAEKTIINQQVTHKLGLPSDHEVTLVRPEGQVSATLVRLRTLRLGDFQVSGLTVISDNLDVLSQALDERLDGILGRDVLNQLRFTIEYSNNRIVLCPPDSYLRESDGSQVRLTSDGHSWFVPVFLNGSIRHELELDTGTNSTTLPWPVWERITEKWQPRNTVGSLRASGEEQGRSYLTRLDALQIGKFSLDRPAVFVHKPASVGTLAEAGAPGLLGGDLLKEFIATVDFPNSWIFLKRDPKYHPDLLRYTGVGLQVRSKGSQFLVAAVWDGSPASQAGIRVGDEIVKIDGRNLNAELAGRTGQLLHRREGTRLTLELRRGNRVFQRALKCRNLLP